MTDIDLIIAPLKDHFLSAFNKLTDSNIPIISEVNNHIHSSHGKQLRPLMTILSACCCGLPADVPSNHPLFSIAAAIETLHASTLIHDDVVDNSDTRRGIPSVKSIWGNKAAVLVGDFYLAKVMQTLNEIDNKDITAIVNNAVIQMSEGELLQLQHYGSYSTDSDIYLAIIERKTASFMSACCHAGATIASDNPLFREQARLFGLFIGIAFQIRDDILDFMPPSLTGKPQGNDLREGKCTLPLIHALQNSISNTKKNLLSLLKDSPLSDTNMHTLIDAITSGGHLKSASLVLNNYLEMARKAIILLPDNIYRNALINITYNLEIQNL